VWFSTTDTVAMTTQAGGWVYEYMQLLGGDEIFYSSLTLILSESSLCNEIRRDSKCIMYSYSK